MRNEHMRVEFELQARLKPWSLNRREADNYNYADSRTQIAWEFWQAARMQDSPKARLGALRQTPHALPLPTASSHADSSICG